MNYVIVNNYLEHHGILGQKWGIRRYQNKDGSYTQAGKMRIRGSKWKSDLSYTQLGKDIPSKKFIAKNQSDPDYEPTYKKGSTVTHITPNEFNSLRKGQDLFISAEDYDKVTYKTWLTLMMKSRGFGKDTPIKEIEFKLKNDLKAPSENNQKKIFDSFYNKNKELVDSDLKEYFNKSKNSNYDKENPYNDYIKSLDRSSNSKKLFYETLKNSGYNAVLDIHDVTGSWMNAKRPLIVMDALNELGDMKVHDISEKELNESLRKYLSMNK